MGSTDVECGTQTRIPTLSGHNADDIAETIVMNVLRGDVARLQRCTAIKTGSSDSSDSESIPR